MADKNAKTEPQNITLIQTLIHGGREIATVTVMPPKVKHQLAAQKSPGTDADRELFLFASLTGLTPDQIGEMHASDYAKLQRVYRDFLS